MIADGERLYDPRLYHDRLLLGLTGMRSSAELHQLKLRMQAGARDIRSAGGVMRSLRAAHLPLPACPRVGPAPYEVVWQPARTSAILDMLQPIDKWEICLHTSYPASITWDEFVTNQAQLRANRLKYREEQPGMARKGQALTSRDRRLWALWSFGPSALLGQAGRMARISL